MHKIVIKNVEWDEFRKNLMIFFDERLVFDVYDGEPEDNNLMRNFKSCYSVPGMLREIYEAGLSGKEIEFKFIEGDYEQY